MNKRQTSIAATATVALLASLVATAPADAASTMRQKFNIINKHFDRCLDSNAKGEVYGLPCNGGNYQKWIWVNGNDQLQNVATGLCLDNNADFKVYTHACNSGKWQKWWYNSSTFHLRTKQNRNYLKMAERGSTTKKFLQMDSGIYDTFKSIYAWDFVPA